MNKQKIIEKEVNLILEIASLLMKSGASASRVNNTIERFASALNCSASNFVSHKSIVTTLKDNTTGETISRVVNVPAHQINFEIISSLSKASWSAIEEQWSLERIQEEIDGLSKIERYPRLLVLIAVSFAGAGFCKIFGGDYWNLLVTFIGTFVGLFVVQSSHQYKYNHYVSVYFGAVAASALAYVGSYFQIGANPEASISTSILFMIPGVALINSFSDLLDSRFTIGTARFINATLIVLAISLGLFTTTLIYKLI